MTRYSIVSFSEGTQVLLMGWGAKMLLMDGIEI